MATFLEHSEDPRWNFNGLSANKAITWSIVEQCPLLDWNVHALSSNSSVATPEVIEGNPDFPWYGDSLSKNPSMTWEFIQSHPELYWDFGTLSSHPCVTIEFLERVNTSSEFLENFPDKYWDYEQFSSNPNITLEFVQAHPEWDWNWEMLSQNSAMTPEVVTTNPDCPWNWHSLSMNPSTTLKFVKDNPEKHWSDFYLNLFHPEFRDFSSVPDVLKWGTMEELRSVIKMSDLVFVMDLVQLSMNTNISWSFVEEFSELKWDWQLLSSNSGFVSGENEELVKRAGF